MAEPYISVGKLGKPHGLSGAFRFLLTRELKNKNRPPAYFLMGKGKTPAPFFVKQIDWTGFNEGMILFEEVDSPEKARLHSGSELLLYEKDVAKLMKKDAGAVSYLVGYKVIDENAGEVGIIDEVIESPGQTLIAVGNKMIPLVDDFVVEVKQKKKELLVNLPEGLLDL